MNEPIISPWLIYWVGRIDFIQTICCVMGFLATALAVTATIVVLTNDYKHEESVKALKILVCAAVILDTLAVFLPTKTELLAMYAAQYITPATIEATGEFTGKTVDMLIEKILKAASVTTEGK